MKPYYEAEGIVIYHGDCREVLPQIVRSNCGALVVDPPYGIAHQSDWTDALYGNVAAAYGDGSVAGDEDLTVRDYVLAWNAGAAALVFGSWKHSQPAGTHTVLVWDKGAASGMGDLSIPWKPSWEEIYVIGRGFIGSRDEGVLKGFYVPPRISMGRQHPMEKPVSLLRYLISKTPSGTVIDPCCGSGPTLRAAKDLGRRAIGIEISEAYCDLAARRLSQEVFPLEVA
jgi:hypothetical protein